MKKRFLIGISFCCMVLLASNAYATEINVDTENKEVKPGEIVTLKISIKDINIEEGINVIQGKLSYDKEIFEKVENQDITTVNNWTMTYNDENTDSEGKFIVLKMSSGEKENQDIVTVDLKVQENANYSKTSIKLQELSTVEGDNIIGIDESKVDIKVEGKISIFKMLFNWFRSILDKK